MPKNTRITVATTTATRAIIAPKLGPSPRSIRPASSHAAWRGAASKSRGDVAGLADQVGDQVDRAGGEHGPVLPGQRTRTLQGSPRIGDDLHLPRTWRQALRERLGRERTRVGA